MRACHEVRALVRGVQVESPRRMHGYRTRDGDAIEFVFEYPDGPLHTTFRWNAADKTWHWLMKMENKSGKWVEFGSMTLTKVK